MKYFIKDLVLLAFFIECIIVAFISVFNVLSF